MRNKLVFVVFADMIKQSRRLAIVCDYAGFCIYSIKYRCSVTITQKKLRVFFYSVIIDIREQIHAPITPAKEYQPYIFIIYHLVQIIYALCYTCRIFISVLINIPAKFDLKSQSFNAFCILFIIILVCHPAR